MLTWAASCQGVSRSNRPGAGSVDAAHAIDGDLLDENVLGKLVAVLGGGRLVGEVGGGVVGHGDSSRGCDGLYSSQCAEYRGRLTDARAGRYPDEGEPADENGCAARGGQAPRAAARHQPSRAGTHRAAAVCDARI